MAKNVDIERLEQRKARLEAAAAALGKRASAEAKRVDTRRKILTGAVVLASVKRDPAAMRWLAGLLDRGLTRTSDRALFATGPLALPQRPGGGDG